LSVFKNDVEFGQFCKIYTMESVEKPSAHVVKKRAKSREDETQKVDPHDLRRYTSKQSIFQETAVKEIKRGQKSSCWMWYVIPTPPWIVNGEERGSWTNQRFSIRSDEQAFAYLEFESDGQNLRNNYLEIMQAIHEQVSSGRDPVRLIGMVDYPKLISSVKYFNKICANGVDDEIHEITKKILPYIPEKKRKKSSTGLFSWMSRSKKKNVKKKGVKRRTSKPLLDNTEKKDAKVPQFSEGDRVRITDAAPITELRGLIGVIGGEYDEDSEKYPVKIKGKDFRCNTKYLKLVPINQETSKDETSEKEISKDSRFKRGDVVRLKTTVGRDPNDPTEGKIVGPQDVTLKRWPVEFSTGEEPQMVLDQFLELVQVAADWED